MGGDLSDFVEGDWPLHGKAETRARLLRQMVTVTAELGHADASVGRVLSDTGIARSTFYEHFSDKAHCLREALGVLARRFGAQVGAVAAVPGTDAAGLIEAVFELAAADRDAARLLFVESLAAGEPALAIRHDLAEELTALIETNQAHLGPGAAILDLPARRLVGGLFRLLAIRLRDDDRDLALLREGFMAWVRSYEVVGRRPLRQEPAPITGALPSPRPVPSLESAHMPAHRPLRRRSVETRRQRIRILSALMHLSYGRGYENVTITDIVELAAVSRKAFYGIFPTKEEAGKEATELVFQSAMGCCAAAFFSVEGWPERIWQGGSALLSFLGANREGSHLAFVESPVIGKDAVEHAYQRLEAFTLFLEEGYRQGPLAEAMSLVASEALMATMYEWAFDELRERRSVEGLLAQLPELSYVILVPFIGPEAAGEVVDARVGSGP